MPRWNRRGTQQAWFVPAISNKSAPTVAEINAGTRVDVALRATAGWGAETEDLDVSDASSTWGKTIPGGKTAEASTMTFYEGDNPADVERAIEAALAELTLGNVVFIPQGTPAAAKRARVHPVRVSRNHPEETAESAGATFIVGFSRPDPPTLNAVIAA